MAVKGKLINGTVKIYRSLPTSYYIGRTKINLRTASTEIQQSEGFYEVVEAVVGENQELIPLVETDLINNQYVERVRDFTQQEIDDNLAEAKTTKIAQVKSELIQLAKDTYWDLDNVKTKEQIITIAKNQFQTKKDEINALTTINEVNNYS